MKVAIFGLGYVGLTATACLTKEGHSVVGLDTNSSKVQQINEGGCPIVEPGLQELLQQALAAKRLNCVTDVAHHLDDCDMAFVCVGTPSGPDGSHNMTFIAEVSRQIAEALSPARSKPFTVVYRSTIRPGTTDELIRPIFVSLLGQAMDKVSIVYNPEFLRESVSINDYFSPPKIVVGTHDGLPNAHMDEINQNLKTKTFYTKYREAEITKFVDNTFHALKVTFANEIGRLSLELGINPMIVHEVFISDTKLNISPYYFRPGGAFGGSCLPKDVRAFQHIAGLLGANTPLIDSLIRSNEAHKRFLFDHCTKGVAPGAKVLMVGLAFKSSSDDLRESPNVDLARFLIQGGFSLDVYDEALDPRKLMGQNLGYAYSRLPTLGELLKSRQHVESSSYDLVIDTTGHGRDLKLSFARFIDLHTLRQAQ